MFKLLSKDSNVQSARLIGPSTSSPEPHGEAAFFASFAGGCQKASAAALLGRVPPTAGYAVLANLRFRLFVPPARRFVKLPHS